MSGKGRRLDSWKAIANHLDRDVRSVQRWEHERGLPVHRIPGQKSGAVFAYESELDRWLVSGGSEAMAATGIIADAVHDAGQRAATGNAARPAGRLPWLVGAGLGALVVVAALGIVLLRGPGRSIPPPLAPMKSLAVLPMVNLSGDPSQTYFADGFTDELTADLAQIHSLRVISRTSTMIYKGSRKPLPRIARELHANYILEGSVARDGMHVRVISQLIDADTDTHVSARSYNEDVTDVLAVQDQISRAIAGDVGLDLSPQEDARFSGPRLVDPAAHDLYLKANFELAKQTPESIRASLALYERAAAKAPLFALAYVGIARVEAALAQITAQSQDESIRLEREALAKALAIDPHLGEAHGLQASLAYYRDWNWPEAEREFRLARLEGARAPTEQRYGVSLITRGRFEEGMEHIQAALELDPLGLSPRVSQFFALYFQRKYPESRRVVDEALRLNPDFLAGHALRGLVALLQHDCSQTTIEENWVQKHFPSPLADFEGALAGACRGDIREARQSLERMEKANGPSFASPYQMALGYALIHDRDSALKYLEKSAAIREPQALYVSVEPVFDGLRSEPRFIALEKRLGFTP
jgi:TolB-like protein